MPVPHSGAQRASLRSRAARSLAAAVLATLVAAQAGASPAAEAYTPSVSAPWHSVEHYALRLINCTRTGGWVRTDGTCAGYGSGRYSKYVPPLRLSAGISDKVARPYARLLARRNVCSHTADGDPGYRLRRAGYRSWRWAENLGCRSGYSNVYKAVLASHLYMQKEKSTNGGHWRNIKNPLYTHVGIGVWSYGGQVRFVSDFYRP